jgi:DNA-binding MarR family transcriptional regulator
MIDESKNKSIIWSNYQRMRVRLAGRISQELAQATGLSEADFEILSALEQAPNQTLRVLALRCGLDWEKSRLSHQLRRMEQRGLIARTECTEDLRGTIVRSTAEGRARACEAKRYYDAAVQRYFVKALSDDQLAALDQIAQQVLEGLGPNPHEPLD